MKLLTWNLKWARPGSKREQTIRSAIHTVDADLICLTEAFRATLPAGGGVIEAATGNPVADRLGAKKVLLWSRWGWRAESVWPSVLPHGRLAMGQTDGQFGHLTVVGVCIPWRSSNMPRFGTGERGPWEDHLDFLKALRAEMQAHQNRTIVIGDFNQRVPRTRQPARVADALDSAFGHLLIATHGFRSSDGNLTIDHIAHSRDLNATDLVELPRFDGALELSDHFGVVADLALTA